MKEKEKKEFHISRGLHFTVRFIALTLVIVLLILTGHAAITFCLGLFADGDYVVNLPGQDSPVVYVNEVPDPTDPVYIDPSQVVEVTRAQITVAGDIMPHMPIVRTNKTSDGYDFTDVFSYIKSYVISSDYAVANLETTFAGTSGKDYAGAPDFNSPDAVAEGAQTTGFDMLLTANEQCFNYGVEGLTRTLSVLKDQNLTTLGTTETKDEPRHAVKNIGGIKVGMAAYTFADIGADSKVTLNKHTASGTDAALISAFDYDNLSAFYQEIEYEISAMRAKGAETIMLYLHWGDEYSTSVSDKQRSIAQKLCDLGVDIVVGSHPHVVQPVDLLTSSVDASHKMVCLYSTGTLLSNLRGDVINQPSGHTEDGMLFTFTLSKYNDGTVRISSVKVLPTWVVVRGTGEGRDFHILPLDQGNGNWKGSFDLSATQLEDARKSFARTMDLVTPGMNKILTYLSEKNAALDPSLGVG